MLTTKELNELIREKEKFESEYVYHWNEHLDLQRKIRLVEGQISRLKKEEVEDEIQES